MLVVEDDVSVANVVGLVLTRAGFDVTTVTDGSLAVDATMRPGAFDVMVLDLMLPVIDGFEVCRAVRSRSSIPIVFLTARQDASDAVKGLELGGDDYVTKPFDAHELVARIRAVLRRANGGARGLAFDARDLRIDPVGFRAQRAGVDIVLSVTEFRLLAFLAARAGVAVSRDELVEHVWGHHYRGASRLVDMAVLRLRDRLGNAPDATPYVMTVRGVGYRFERG